MRLTVTIITQARKKHTSSTVELPLMTASHGFRENGMLSIMNTKANKAVKTRVHVSSLLPSR